MPNYFMSVYLSFIIDREVIHSHIGAVISPLFLSQRRHASQRNRSQ